MTEVTFMADFTFKITQWNQFVLDNLAAKALLASGEVLKGLIKRELASGGHSDTGVLADSFEIHPGLTPFGPEITVSSSVNYAQWVNYGTAARIYPQSAPVLRFKPGKKGSHLGKRGQYNARSTGRFSSGYLYRPYVSGQPATHFFNKAVDQLRIADFVI
jgi:hypothetical protein